MIKAWDVWSAAESRGVTVMRAEEQNKEEHEEKATEGRILKTRSAVAPNRREHKVGHTER